MIEQRPYVNQLSAYLYNLYDTSLGKEADNSVDLKVNIERTLLSQARDVSSPVMMPAEEFERVNTRRQQLQTVKEELLKRIKLNNDLLKTLKVHQKRDALILRSYEVLQTLNDKLISVEDELSIIGQKLDSHYAKVSMLVSVQNLVVSANAKSVDQVPGSTLSPLDAADSSFDFVGANYLDELVSHVAAVAAQRNVNLPPPSFSDGSAEDKVTWVKTCIDSVALAESSNANPQSTSTPMSLSKSGQASNNESVNLKTALQDLQFAHQYLTKQYEEERAVNAQTMSSLRLKLQNSQEALMKTNKELSNQTHNLINLEMQLNNAEVEKVERVKEIGELNKKMSLLQVDHLGERPMQQLSPPSSKDEDMIQQQPLSPVTGVGFAGMTTSTSRPVSSEFGEQASQKSISNSILRLEFKKLLQDITAKHEEEMSVERNERKRLENLVKLMNQS